MLSFSRDEPFEDLPAMCLDETENGTCSYSSLQTGSSERSFGAPHYNAEMILVRVSETLGTGSARFNEDRNTNSPNLYLSAVLQVALHNCQIYPRS
jgi:hypothetical protein